MQGLPGKRSDIDRPRNVKSVDYMNNNVGNKNFCQNPSTHMEIEMLKTPISDLGGRWLSASSTPTPEVHMDEECEESRSVADLGSEMAAYNRKSSITNKTVGNPYSLPIVARECPVMATARFKKPASIDAKNLKTGKTVEIQRPLYSSIVSRECPMMTNDRLEGQSSNDNSRDIQELKAKHEKMQKEMKTLSRFADDTRAQVCQTDKTMDLHEGFLVDQQRIIDATVQKCDKANASIKSVQRDQQKTIDATVQKCDKANASIKEVQRDHHDHEKSIMKIGVIQKSTLAKLDQHMSKVKCQINENEDSIMKIASKLKSSLSRDGNDQARSLQHRVCGRQTNGKVMDVDYMKNALQMAKMAGGRS